MLEDSDYETLVEWWSYYKFPVPPKEFLPDAGTCGIILENEKGYPYCAGFIYFTNSGLCWMEYVVSNPKVKGGVIRSQMIRELIDNLTEFAREEGSKWMFTSSDHEKFIRKLIDSGFHVGDRNTTQLLKTI